MLARFGYSPNKWPQRVNRQSITPPFWWNRELTDMHTWTLDKITILYQDIFNYSTIKPITQKIILIIILFCLECTDMLNVFIPPVKPPRALSVHKPMFFFGQWSHVAPLTTPSQSAAVQVKLHLGLGGGFGSIWQRLQGPCIVSQSPSDSFVIMNPALNNRSRFSLKYNN